MPAPSGFIHRYLLDEASGNALDAVSGGTDLTESGSPGTAAGVLDGARDLEADTPSYFSHDLSIPASFTWGVWIRPESFSGERQVCGLAESIGGFAVSGNIALSSGTPYFYIFDPSFGARYTYGSAINLDEWIHLTVTFEATVGMVLYYNGVFENGQSAISHYFASTTANFAIGGYNGNFPGSFDGLVDDLLFYDRALSDVEVAALYASYFTSTRRIFLFPMSA